jgi:hypothetical protein
MDCLAVIACSSLGSPMPQVCFSLFQIGNSTRVGKWWKEDIRDYAPVSECEIIIHIIKDALPWKERESKPDNVVMVQKQVGAYIRFVPEGVRNPVCWLESCQYVRDLLARNLVGGVCVILDNHDPVDSPSAEHCI